MHLYIELAVRRRQLNCMINFSFLGHVIRLGSMFSRRIAGSINYWFHSMFRFFVVGLFAVPTIAMANVVWPALYLVGGFYTWWVIAIGLAIEFIAIQRLFALNPSRAALVDVTANAVSALLGVVLIPLAGIIYEFFPGSLVNWAFSWGTFNPIAWVATVLLGAAVNLFVEGQVMKRIFSITLSKRTQLVLYVTNLITVTMALYPMSQNMRNGA